MASEKPITELLGRWREGSDAALAELTPLVYDQLRALANSAFRSERGGHTLQPTAIVHEAYIKLIDASIEWKDQQHFFAIAARMMRRLLINHAHAKRAQKRGDGAIMMTLDEGAVAGQENVEDVLDLDQGLVELATVDQRKADILELHYFAGMTYEEAAAALDISDTTAARDLRFAKAWMRKYLAQA